MSRRQKASLATLVAIASSVAMAVSAGRVVSQVIGSDSLAAVKSAAVPRVIVADGSFAYAPSPVTGSAAWSAEFITREMLTGEGRRPSSFHEDPDLPEHLRAKAKDYARSGLDAGHLAADANTGDQQGKRVRARFTNVVPQSAKLNRGLWLEIESHVRDLVRESDGCYVVTAPAYRAAVFAGTEYGASPALPRVGDLIKPTHLVKAVLVIKDGKPDHMECWSVFNVDPKPGAKPDDYRYPVDFAEELLQLDLFGWLDDETESRMEASL